MGAALEQKIDSKWVPLTFFSRKFSPAQSKYSAYDRELTAIVEGIKHFLHDLEGRSFKVYMTIALSFTLKHNLIKKHHLIDHVKYLTFLSST